MKFDFMVEFYFMKKGTAVKKKKKFGIGFTLLAASDCGRRKLPI